ncbi:MAG: DUF4255 domain-containing protein [bacterium]
MSNFLAIATVTATLRHILLDAVQSDVPGAEVTTEQPNNLVNQNPAPRVNIYLYQVTPNAAYRNTDLPTRRSNSQMVQRPRAAIDLHYLLTVYGNEVTLEPQRLLGSTVRTIHEHPVLTREDIKDVIINPTYNFLARSNLADEVELVKFTPTSISLEELSKLWSVFFQIPYSLSVSFQATVVLIESEITTKPALPVLERNIVVQPFRGPVIETILSEDGADAAILSSSTILIRGKKLQSKNSQVRIGGQLATPQSVVDTEIKLSLSTLPNIDELQAGVQGIQVVHVIFAGPPPYGFESNVAAFVLQPNFDEADIQYDENKQEVQVTVQPRVGKMQRVLLLLNTVPTADNSTSDSYSFPAAPREQDSRTVNIPIRDVKNGLYLVRLQIDGAQSPLQVDEGGKFEGPKIQIGPAPPLAKLRVTDIGLSFEESGGVFNVNALISVKDEANAAVEGAALTALWTLPDATEQSKNATTNSSGVALFTISNGTGEYSLEIKEVSKANFNFDSANSVLKKSISTASPLLKMRSTRIELEKEIKNEQTRIRAKVTVRDENQEKISEANVFITWFLPEGGSAQQNELTDTRGVARFMVLDGDGTYTLNINNIEKSGYEFDRENSDLVNAIVIGGDTGAGGTPIRSEKIELEAEQREGKIRVRAKVTVKDESKEKIADAAVSATWTLPNGRTEEQTENTDSRGVARFSTEDGDGVYTLNITNIVKTGFRFDPSEGEIIKTHTV